VTIGMLSSASCGIPERHSSQWTWLCQRPQDLLDVKIIYRIYRSIKSNSPPLAYRAVAHTVHPHTHRCALAPSGIGQSPKSRRLRAYLLYHPPFHVYSLSNPLFSCLPLSQYDTLLYDRLTPRFSNGRMILLMHLPQAK
jgi:hypothetical protein